MGRVVFGMVGNRTRPIGGVKVIYQAVAGLRRHGIDAYVLAEPEPPAWLAGSRALADATVIDNRQRLQLAPDDVFVAIDAMGPNREELLLSRPERRVMFIQNHNAVWANTEVNWDSLRHIRILTVSEFSRRRLIEDAGFETVSVVHPGVDLSVFRPAAHRRHQIAYMPRKWPELAAKVRARGDRTVEWVAIDGKSEAETAAILAASTVFLNLGRREGFGLPPLEAMAAGCVVCGFASQGTTDFATPDNGFWADEGDVDACVRAVGEALGCIADPDRHARMTAGGMRTAEQFALPVFEQRMAGYFRGIM